MKKFKDIKEIVELVKDEVEKGNENVTAILDYQDLKALLELYNLYENIYKETLNLQKEYEMYVGREYSKMNDIIIKLNLLEKILDIKEGEEQDENKM